MIKIGNFLNDHKAILEFATELGTLLNEETVTNKSSEVLGVLAKLSGRIKMHLSLEDKYLYPEMIMSDNAELKKVAEKFQKEMGNIRETYVSFTEKWKTAAHLKEAPNDFIKEVNAILDVLGKRIEAEEKNLYPLANLEK